MDVRAAIPACNADRKCDVFDAAAAVKRHHFKFVCFVDKSIHTNPYNNQTAKL